MITFQKFIELLMFGAIFLIFNLHLLSILEDPFLKLVMVVFTIWIIIGAIICSIVQSKEKEINLPIKVIVRAQRHDYFCIDRSGNKNESIEQSPISQDS